MKQTFELLVFSGADSNKVAQTADPSDPVPAAASPTTTAAVVVPAPAAGGTVSGVQQGAKWQERVTALKALAATLNLHLHDETALVGPTADTVACDVEWPIDKIGRGSVVVVAGSPSAEQLSAAADTLKHHGNDVIVTVDALKDLPSLLEILAELNEHGVQMIAAGAVESLVKGEHLMVYRYSKADQTATIAMFADIDSDDPLVLTMVRGHEPFKGCESFPGGFLNPQLENLPECAARELMEECFVNKKKTGYHDRFTYFIAASDMVLIDVRSDPHRDERGHVVDHGYAYFIPKDAQAEVMSKANAGDDAQEGSARFVRVSELMKRELAFDHKKLLEAAVLYLKAKRASK